MTRRPRSKRPPRLDLPTPPLRAAVPKPRVQSARRSLVATRLAGVPSTLGRAELETVVAAVVAGRTDATFGLDLAAMGAGRPERADVWAAWAEGWGWPPGDAPTIAVERTVAACDLAADQLAAVCRAGGSVALATSRPASMLWCYQELAGQLTRAGATVLRSNAPGHETAGGPARRARTVWWLGGVGVVTDGRSIRADDGVDVAEDWLFGVGRPDLVIADRSFAAAAVACGHPTVAPVDLDAVALELAARRGALVTTVPVDCGRPPEAYRPLVALLTARLDGLDPATRPDPPREERPPHSTTPAPGAYAAPESGGEG